MFNKIFLISILLTFLSIRVSAQDELWAELHTNNQSLFSEKLTAREHYERLSAYNEGTINRFASKTRLDSSYQYYPHPDDNSALYLRFRDYYRYDSAQFKRISFRFMQNIEISSFDLELYYSLFTYDSFGKIRRKLREPTTGLDFSFFEKNPVSEVLYEYDNEQKLLFERFYNFSDNGVKIPIRYRKYTYDFAGKLDTSQFVRVDSADEETITRQVVYHTDSLQRLEWAIQSIVEPEGLVKVDSTYYFYDGQGLLEKEIIYELIESMSTSRNITRAYNYDDQGRLNGYMDSNSFSQLKENIQLLYDNQGALEHIQYIDDSGLLLEETVYTTYGEARQEDLYVIGGLVPQMVDEVPIVPGQAPYHPFIISNVTERSFDDIDFDFTDHYSLDYFYSSVETTAVTAPSSVSPILFSPNPAHRSIRMFSSEQRGQAQVRIFSGSGNLVHSQLIQAGDEISVENWDAGVYFYLVDWGDVQQTGKVVKVE